MKIKNDPRQLLLPLEYSKKHIGDAENSIAVEQREIKKAHILYFSSFARCAESEKQAHEKSVLLSAAQKLKW